MCTLQRDAKTFKSTALNGEAEVTLLCQTGVASATKVITMMSRAIAPAPGVRFFSQIHQSG